MDNILDRIIANKRKELKNEQQAYTIREIISALDAKQYTGNKALFTNSLIQSDTGIISEFKRKSPSRGWIFEDAKIENIIPQYSIGGASAISVLTDYDFFGGNLADLEQARRLTKTPLLRKDFTIDEYQLYQAALYGANAILLIASALSIEETNQLAQKARSLQLDVLLEIHNEKELDHINEYVDVVGVNNRNLSTFVTDVQISFDLIDKIPSEFLRISESGISDVQTVKDLRQAGYRGFLMGENFMKTNNPGKSLSDFIQELKK